MQIAGEEIERLRRQIMEQIPSSPNRERILLHSTWLLRSLEVTKPVW